MWDERYAQPGFAYGTEPNDFLASVADRISGRSVLCLAEGEGRNAVFLAQRGLEVLAVDSSPVGLNKAEALAAERGVSIETRAVDLAEYVIEPGRWDAVVAIFAHVPPPLRRRLHRAAAAGLRPGGVFILEAYRPAQLEHGTGGPPVLELLMSLDELREDLQGLQLEIAEETTREIHEGKYHTGTGAVVQVVARRRSIEPSTA